VDHLSRAGAVAAVDHHRGAGDDEQAGGGLKCDEELSRRSCARTERAIRLDGECGS
jgi:hypothetical protein